MSRFYIPPDQCKDPVLFLTGREAHHAVKVLRLRRGEQTTVLDGEGHEFRCEIEAFDRDKVLLKVLETKFTPALRSRITLVQALPKGKLIESLVQKATELGVWRVVPLMSERVVAQIPEKKAARKTGKWQLIAIEAIKQCGSPWLPKVEEPVTPAEFIARGESFDLPLIASLHGGSKHPRSYFETFCRQHGRKPGSMCVWVGPEGDFSPREVAIIQDSGALPISLGPLVLRVETAALYCLSILNYEAQESQ